MKKFECNKCIKRSCTATYPSDDEPPKYCTRLKDKKFACWKEVKEDKEIKEESEQLPDWCKVGEWVYYPEDMGHGVYLKITEIKRGKAILS